MTFNVIETFSGIGSQAKALSNIQKKDPTVDFNISATVEWEIGAMYAYDLLHNGNQKLDKYKDFSKEDIILILNKYNLSSDGKNPLAKKSLQRMPLSQLKAILYSIQNNNNLVDISKVNAINLPEADLLTYSFPCQDLSISSYWHGNISGINKDIKNRSGLLWEIERILKEYKDLQKKMPRFLLMENVSAIHSSLHDSNFKLWQHELKDLGYMSEYDDLNAIHFGIPQNRLRTFMISIYAEDLNEWQKNEIRNFFEQWKYREFQEKPKIDSFLRLDYSIPKYYQEALESTPNNTDSRKKIMADSLKLAYGNKTAGTIAKTITTKQDRNPNAGIIIHESDFGPHKSKYRNLTPRETFLLMGFEEKDFDRLIENNIYITKSRKLLSRSKLLKLAGNSIVVNVLEDIFTRIINFNYEVIEPNNIVDLKQKMG